MKAVIMAGGKGSRLLPLTKDMPKPMVKLIDKPILEYIIELLVKHNITDINIALGYMPEKIIEYFGDGSAFGVNITYFVENQPLGTAGCVKGCLNSREDDFLVISGDAFTEINLTKAINFHYAKESLFTIISQPHYNPVGLGLLDIDENFCVTAFIEKPEKIQPSLISTGIYIINKNAMTLVPENTKYDFAKELIPRLLGQVYAYVDYSYWTDIGTLSSYYATNLKIAETINT